MKKQGAEEVVRAEYVSKLETESLQLLRVVEETKTELERYYPQMPEEERDAEVQGRADSLKRATSNLTKALAQTYAVSDELSARWTDIKNQRKKRRLISAAPANTTIDVSESRSDHFAKGRNGYKLLLVCFIGSFAGVVVELFWCLITNGYLESRSGLVWGPFNLLYGVGAVVLTMCLYQYRNRSSMFSFLGGMIVGSVVEYACSWGQEMIFGTRSWDYSHLPFNLNGRICLLYSILWGILGVMWIKSIYPRMAKWILRVPNRTGKIVTWIFVGFFLVNGVVTSAAMYRWTERVDGLMPSNAVEELLDARFPDERMERVFANLSFVDEG